MKPKELGKTYLVAFCKGCTAGFRVREEALREGQKIEIPAPETHRCPACGLSAEYAREEMRVATYQKQGFGKRRGAVT